jgi:hypothetical protein
MMMIAESPEYTPTTVSVEQLEKYISFHQFEKYLMTKIGYKVFITANFLTLFDGEVDEKGITSSSIKLYTKSDVNNLLTSFISAYNKFHELGYNYPFKMTNIKIRVAKIKALTGSSYIELPTNINNKKAVINIKNEDNYCFIYSVLCGLKLPTNHPERVSHYKDRMKELNYKDEDMPMEINKIMYFEKRKSGICTIEKLVSQKIIGIGHTHNLTGRLICVLKDRLYLNILTSPSM